MARLIFLSAILAGICLMCISGAINDGCPGGYREGSQVTLGLFWYDCRNGQLVPKGCLTPDNGRVELSRFYDSKSVRWQCTVDRDGYLALVHHACVDNGGRERQANERWDDGKVVYNCRKGGDYVSIESVGCVGDGNRRMNLGDKATVRDIVYECRQNVNAVPTLRQWGCAGKDGRQYATGEQFENGDFLYYCMSKDGNVRIDRVGCVHNGLRMNDGDRYFLNEIIYQCYVREDVAEVRVAGCVTKNFANGAQVERRVGCSWLEGDAPFQVSFTCKGDDAVKTATKIADFCSYSLDRGTVKVELGCYRVVDKTGVGCVKGSSVGEARLIPLALDENDQVRSPPSGLRSC